MKTIRYGSFETNSSSTHAIVVPKTINKEDWDMGDSLDHNYEFSREECRLVDHWDEKLAYVYMVLLNFKNWEDGGRHIKIDDNTLENFKSRINKLYDEVKKVVMYKPYESDPKPNDIFSYIDSKGESKLGDIVFDTGWGKPYPYVDHCEDFDTNGFLEKVLNDEQFLKKFIFNNGSYITVGGDEYRGYNIKTVGFQYDYEEHYYVNDNGERPPKEWFKKDGRIKKKYWDRYYDEYNIDAGGFWDRLKEYEKDNDVFLKGN